MENTRINVMQISSIDPYLEECKDEYVYKDRFLTRREGFYKDGEYLDDEIRAYHAFFIKDLKVYQNAFIRIRMNNGCSHLKHFDSDTEMSKYLKSSRFKHLTLLEL